MRVPIATPSLASKPSSEPCLMLLGDQRQLAEVVAADAAHQRAGAGAGAAGGQHLALDQRDGARDARHAAMRSATAA